VTAGPARLALLGDVHGNVAALEAVLAQVAAREIPRGACTGDLVLRGGQPDACVARMALLEWPCVAGNTDVKVVARPPRQAPHPAVSRPGSRSWTAHRLSDESLRWLRGLPLSVRLRVGRFEVLVMHGSPEDPSEVLFDVDSDHAHLAALAARFGVDALVTGHTHRPMARTVAGCLFVNPGSVGEAQGDDRRPAWAWLEAAPSGLVAHLERVDAPVAVPRPLG
jgi:putative phosphoesterase